MYGAVEDSFTNDGVAAVVKLELAVESHVPFELEAAVYTVEVKAVDEVFRTKVVANGSVTLITCPAGSLLSREKYRSIYDTLPLFG